MPHIFDYLDYRKFFEEWLEFKKSQNSRFSLRLVAKQIECNPSFLVRVLQGKKNMSSSLLLKLSEAIKLTKKGTEYLELLLQLEKAESQKEKKFFMEKLTKLRKAQVKAVNTMQYEYYDKWYYTVIREILAIDPFKGNFTELAKKLDPPIKPTEAQKAVEVLIDLGFIQKNSTGVYVPTSSSVTSGEGWRSLALASYQMENLDLAKSAFDKFSEEERNISTLTLSVSKESYDTMSEKLRNLRAEFLEMEKKDNKRNRVYQMNFQIFPVSSELKDKKD